MPELCHHYSSETGRKCKAVATVRVREKISNDSAAPKWWECMVCAKHSEGYIHVERYQLVGA